MTALILAATSDQRWRNHLGVPKHLVPIKGEPLIHRTQRALLERGERNVIVMTQPQWADDYVIDGATWQEPKPSPREFVQEWDGSRHLWNDAGKTLIVYGDCYMTDELLDAMTQDSGEPWKAWARWNPSPVTGKEYGEMFGWTFTPEAHDLLDRARADAIAAHLEGRWHRVLGWEVYRLAVGFQVAQHEREDVHGIDWSDASDDFDRPRDWDKWLERNRHLAE